MLRFRLGVYSEIVYTLKSMNLVISTIKEHIANQSVHFVFPSQTAAGLWAGKTCTLGIARSLAADRFLAWDRFKEEAVREKDAKTASPASSITRKLFAEALIRKNAQTPFLKSLIPPQYAQGGGIFVPFIARLLPSLYSWEKLMKSRAPDTAMDAEDQDYALVKKEYASFLERFCLFEPSWEELSLSESNKRYVIFFPELIEDFSEYDALLPAPRFIRVKAELVPAPSALLLFQSAREEIRSTVMEIQRLHEEEGFPYEEMAVSVPELDEIEPWLQLELSLRHIPFTRRAGKKLGESGVGRFFSLLSEASIFSFNSLKALLLNDHIPWKEREKNKALVSFGIKYNCVKGYVQDGKSVDIWEEAFKEAYKDGERDLLPYYRELKKGILAITGSRNFNELRKYYFSFRGTLLDMEKISEEDNAVLSRCIEELGILIELEEKFNDPALAPASPFSFFLSCLGEREYVLANQLPGVNIFKWRVAAASPFSCHFVLNASQSAASVLYQPMKFLRQDKRKTLGLEDKDATGAFFKLCDTGEYEGFASRTRISASYKTFSGWAIPHSFFAQNKSNSNGSDTYYQHDPYIAERRLWRTEKNEGAVLQKIFPLQKHSYGLWEDALIQKENHFSFFTFPVSESSIRELLTSVILGKDGFLTVTATGDLNEYFNCTLKWLYKRILGIGEFSLEASLLDDISLGILYHRILEKLFDKIKNEDVSFNSVRLDIYKSWAMGITKAAIKEEPAFKGPLAVPLVSPQAAGMSKKIAALLDIEAKLFDKYKVVELELPVEFKTGELLIRGIIDRVSVSPEGEPVIVDYKTNFLPDQTGINDLQEVPLSEFQMPLYIKLYEEKSGGLAHSAFFYSINSRKIKVVVGENTSGRSKTLSREEYTPFLEALEQQIEEFAQKVKALDFVPREIHFRDCLACMYKTICRSTLK